MNDASTVLTMVLILAKGLYKVGALEHPIYAEAVRLTYGRLTKDYGPDWLLKWDSKSPEELNQFMDLAISSTNRPNLTSLKITLAMWIKRILEIEYVDAYGLGLEATMFKILHSPLFLGLCLERLWDTL